MAKVASKCLNLFHNCKVTFVFYEEPFVDVFDYALIDKIHSLVTARFGVHHAEINLNYKQERAVLMDQPPFNEHIEKSLINHFPQYYFKKSKCASATSSFVTLKPVVAFPYYCLGYMRGACLYNGNNGFFFLSCHFRSDQFLHAQSE